MPKITGWQIVKSLLFTAAGAAPGLIWYFNARTTQSVVIACLGTFIGFALSLPGVSAGRVAGGTAGLIIAKNAPRSMQGEIMDTFVGDGESPETQDNKDAST